jgi:hypothetical protein
MKRVTFGQDADLFGSRRVVELFNDYIVRILTSPNSPERPGERFHCVIGEAASNWDNLFWVTEVDPSTEEFESIGLGPVQVRIETMHVL